MAKSTNTNKSLIAAIIFAAIIVGGSMVFFATQLSSKMSDEDLQAAIFKGIDAYIANEQEKANKAMEEANKPRTVSVNFEDDDPFLGDKDAPVVMVEFSDYECPFCSSFYLETLPKIKETYIDTGKVKFVYRDLPLSKHASAYPAALFAECARDQGGDEVYYKIHDQLFETVTKEGFDYESMSNYATSLGLNTSKLKECFDNEDFKDEINGDMEAADKLGIDGTPGFVINDQLVSGARPFEYFAQIIDAELENN